MINFSFVLGGVIQCLVNIWAYYAGDYFTAYDYNFCNTFRNVTGQISYLFLELAMTVNLAVWVYFFMKIQTHRDIRYDEIFAQMMYGEEDKSKKQKEQHLIKFNQKSRVIYIVVAVIVTFLLAIYIYFAVRIAKDTFNYDDEEIHSDYNKIYMLQWIFSTTFSVMIILISLSVICKIRLRFNDLWSEYGCYLWTVFTVQALSMLIQTTIQVLLIYDYAVFINRQRTNFVL